MKNRARNGFPIWNNSGIRVHILHRKIPLLKLPDGIVTVHLDDKRYRGAYYFRGDKLVVTAYGIPEASADLEVLGGERGKAAVNLAKLVLIDMVRDQMEIPDWHPELALQGTTTQIFF